MISVYLCSYNGELFIKQQLESIANQTLLPDEVIISDDSSTDHTLEIINSFIARNNLSKNWHVVKNMPRLGYPLNFYLGVERCSGDYIFFADQDDVWESDKIFNMMCALQRHHDINVLACACDAIDSEGRKIYSLLIPRSKRRMGELTYINISDICYEYRWPGMAMAVRKNWALQFITAAQGFNIPHDLLFAVIAALSKTFCEINILGAHHRRHQSNTAREKHKIKDLLNYNAMLIDIKNEIEIYSALNQYIYSLYDKRNAEITEKIKYLNWRLELLECGNIREYLRYTIHHREKIRFCSFSRDFIIFIISKIIKKGKQIC